MNERIESIMIDLMSEGDTIACEEIVEYIVKLERENMGLRTQVDNYKRKEERRW